MILETNVMKKIVFLSIICDTRKKKLAMLHYRNIYHIKYQLLRYVYLVIMY